MKYLILFPILGFTLSIQAQSSSKISSIDFVQVQNENYEETKFYYQNNWMILRKEALKKDYIESYQLLETTYSEEAPFHFMLITTYANDSQYEAREENFGKLIDARGGIRLLNEKKPGEFRKVIFYKDPASHLE